MTRYTLLSHGRVLGRTGVELPPQSPGMRGWHFVPGPAFAEVAPLFAALPLALNDFHDALPSEGELEAIPEADRPTRIREILLADPRHAPFLEATNRIMALALELQNDEGARVETKTISVGELGLPVDAFAEVLACLEPDVPVADDLAAPLYVLAVTLV